jgi:hypothetical protein
MLSLHQCRCAATGAPLTAMETKALDVRLDPKGDAPGERLWPLAAARPCTPAAHARCRKLVSAA